MLLVALPFEDKLGPGVVLAVAADDMEQCDVVEHLVPVVPGEEGSLSGVVIHHTDVGILVVEGNVGVLVRGGVGVVGKVDLGSGQVGVGDVQGSADHEGLPCAALGKARVPALQDLQRARVQTAHLGGRGELFNPLSSKKHTNARTFSPKLLLTAQSCVLYESSRTANEITSGQKEKNKANAVQ